MATDVYIRGNLCESSKTIKSVRKSKKTEFQVEMTTIYSLKSITSALKSSDLKLFQSKHSGFFYEKEAELHPGCNLDWKK